MSLPAERVCCDPLKRHTTPQRKDLRAVPYAIIAEHSSLGLTRRNYLCTKCRKKLNALRAAATPTPEDAGEMLPMDDDDSRQESSSSSDSTTESLPSDSETSIFKRPRVEGESETTCSKDDDTYAVTKADGEEMIEQLIEKLKSATVNSERLLVLTAVPKSWSVRKTAQVFNVSRQFAGKAKKLVEERGVLSSPYPKEAKAVTLAEEEVHKFYLSDDISRIMPGMKDYVSVRGTNGQRVHQQKRLLLCNLREAYSEFKKRNPRLKVGFSRFAQLRPRECILAGASGTHTVCVCQIHQNAKLMMVGSKLEKLYNGEVNHYRHCLAKMQCIPPSLDCSLGTCTECPGVEQLCAELQAVFDDNDIDKVEYSQWTNTDRSTLERKVQGVDEFLEDFSVMMQKLQLHDLIAKMQADFMRQKKQNLGPGEFLVLADFSENFSFVVQDEVQSFHWNNNSATIHPFVCYSNEGSFCFVVISECTQHDVIAVHLFQRKLVDFLTQQCGGQRPKKLYYMSDGCAGQYKNCKNFLNLCHHFEDFGVYAEWHFFATSHGKSPCDGAGGTLKRIVTKVCLQRLYEDQILTAHQLFEFAVSNIKGMHFCFTDTSQHEEEAKLLEERMQKARTVPGTQRLHCFIPLSTETVEVRQFSTSTISRVERVLLKGSTTPCTPPPVAMGYVTVAYDNSCWLGYVIGVNELEGGVKVKFLHPRIPSSSFVYPNREDIMDMDPSDILTHVAPTTATGRTYTLSRKEMSDATTALALKYQ
ncbi:hypothetical protein EMCRGX_G003713 [Ephydatia muelleri]